MRLSSLGVRETIRIAVELLLQAGIILLQTGITAVEVGRDYLSEFLQVSAWTFLLPLSPSKSFSAQGTKSSDCVSFTPCWFQAVAAIPSFLIGARIKGQQDHSKTRDGVRFLLGE